MSNVGENRPGTQRKKRPFFGNQFTNKTTVSKADNETSDVLPPKQGDATEVNKIVSGSFNWRPYLRKPNFSAAPVSCFKHVAFSNCWDSIVFNVRVEVRSPDCKTCCTTDPCSYWIATVIKVCGYWGLLRYDGFDKFSPHYFNVPDRWVNLCTEQHIHPIGWCADNQKLLVPPKSVEPKIICWKAFLMEMMTGGRTIPPDFTFKIEEHSLNTIKKGMKLEVVDKNLISVVRSAIVTDVVGGRLHIKYADPETEDEGFWCHERSPLIHPVGWAQIIGHALKARPEYARQSLKKTLYRTFASNDATWDMFLPVYNPENKFKFKAGMKLEAIDPLNLSTICVATVTEVLRNNYLMIGIEGMMAPNGADCFCYHASSPCIFPVGFCESHGIKLTPPRGYKGDFKWSEYLKKTKAEAAPVNLFRTDIPDHGFREGMHLEAVDLMEPRLICVAHVTKVVGRLLKVHFEGWEDDYDQWCDCESPDLFPIGWCDVLGYRLEPPRVAGSEDKKKKKVIVKRRKRGRPWSKRPTSSDDSPNIPQEQETFKSFDIKHLRGRRRQWTKNPASSDDSLNISQELKAFKSIDIKDTKEKKKTTPPNLSPKNPLNSQKGKLNSSKNVEVNTPATTKPRKTNFSRESSGDSLTGRNRLGAKRLTYDETVASHKRKPRVQHLRNKTKTPAYVSYADDSSMSSSADENTPDHDRGQDYDVEVDVEN